MIFVSIASYREPKLVETVLSCLNEARDCENIRIGIYWQYDETENPNYFDTYSNVYVKKIPYKEAHSSVVWARIGIIEDFYEPGDFYFQIDAHSIFNRHWDSKIMDMYKSLPVKKSLITGPPPFYYDEDQEHGSLKEHHPDDPVMWREHHPEYLFSSTVKFAKVAEISENGFFGCYPINAFQTNHPTFGRHFYANQIFAPPGWIEEVPYDADMYFTGEEPLMGIRSWTSGYELYQPNTIIIWHQKYFWDNKKRHWDDNTLETELHTKSDSKLRDILLNRPPLENYGKYSLGEERTIEQWEEYTGIGLQDRIMSENAALGIPPENTIGL